jgi:hypothetical protein
MNISTNQLVSPALKTARDFLILLQEMEDAYDSADSKNKSWVYKDQEVIQRWIAKLELVRNSEDFDGVWREVQNISKILGCTIDDDLGERYRILQSKFFEEMTKALHTFRRVLK